MKKIRVYPESFSVTEFNVLLLARPLAEEGENGVRYRRPDGICHMNKRKEIDGSGQGEETNQKVAGDAARGTLTRGCGKQTPPCGGTT